MICRHCGGEIREIRPFGAHHDDDDRIFVHVDGGFARCMPLGERDRPAEPAEA